MLIASNSHKSELNRYIIVVINKPPFFFPILLSISFQLFIQTILSIPSNRGTFGYMDLGPVHNVYHNPARYTFPGLRSYNIYDSTCDSTIKTPNCRWKFATIVIYSRIRNRIFPGSS